MLVFLRSYIHVRAMTRSITMTYGGCFHAADGSSDRLRQFSIADSPGTSMADHGFHRWSRRPCYIYAGPCIFALTCNKCVAGCAL